MAWAEGGSIYFLFEKGLIDLSKNYNCNVCGLDLRGLPDGQKIQSGKDGKRCFPSCEKKLND